MSRIILDAATADALRHAEPGAELIGPDGQTVGGFVPANILSELRSLLERRRKAIDEAFAAITDEEWDAATAEKEGIPHDEVVKRLGLA